MASAGLVFGIMIIAVLLAREAYGTSEVNIAGRKVLRDGKMEVFKKEESDGKQRPGPEEKPKIPESYGSEKTSGETADQVSALEGSMHAMHDYGQEPPHGRRKPPINNNDPGN